MKKKAGQASSTSKPSSTRSSELVPVNNSSPNKPKVSDDTQFYMEPSKKKEVSDDTQFYMDLSKSSDLEKSDMKSTSKNVTGGSSKSTSKGSSKSSSSSNVKSTVRTAKSTTKRSKSKKKNPGPVIAVVAAIILVAGGVLLGLYYTGFFKPQIEVTMADGSLKKIKAEEAYAELMTDKFFAGTVIDGIEVGGMTADEAFSAVSTTLPEAPLKIDINLNLEGKKLPVDFSDASFEYNTREVINEAFAKFRPLNDTDLVQLAECYNGMEQLKITPQTFETAYTVQIDGVSNKVHGILDPLVSQYATVKDASIESFDTETKTFVVTPEQTGYILDIDGTADAVKALFDSKTYSGTVDVPTKLKEPEVTADMINENFGLIGECSTKTSNNSNRNTNISQACKNMTGTILEPGDEFSFNKIVGQRTYANGFREATVIMGGQYEQGLGGGICQVSSTLYNAVLKADLKVTEAHPHAWPSDYVLTGLDATVDWPSLDFKFQNSSDYQVIVVAWWDSSDSTVHAEIYGKKFPNGETIVLDAEIVGTSNPGATEYVEDKTLEVGKTKTVRSAHYGQTAKVYKIWQDKDGNEIKREEYDTRYYRAFGKRIAVGVLKPDGTYATIDKTTGEITSPSETPTPTVDPNLTPTPDPNVPSPTTAPQPDTPTPVPQQDTPTPTPVPENGGGENGGGENGGGENGGGENGGENGGGENGGGGE